VSTALVGGFYGVAVVVTHCDGALPVLKTVVAEHDIVVTDGEFEG